MSTLQQTKGIIANHNHYDHGSEKIINNEPISTQQQNYQPTSKGCDINALARLFKNCQQFELSSPTPTPREEEEITNEPSVRRRTILELEEEEEEDTTTTTTVVVMMDSLLADCLPFLSDHLQVQDLFRLESVSKLLRDTIRRQDDGGDNINNYLFHRAIRAKVGYYENDEYYPSTTIPVKTFPDKEEEESKWDDRYYSAQTMSYPARLCFHAKLKHDGFASVEDLSVEKIREMGQSMARLREDLKKGSARRRPSDKDEEGSSPSSSTSGGAESSWDRWYCNGYLGLRGGCHYVLERKTVPLRSNDDIPYAYVPNDLNKPRPEWLKDSSDTIFAITMGKQLLRRIIPPNPKQQQQQHSDRNTMMMMCHQTLPLTNDQAEIAKQFLTPHVWKGGGATTYNNANSMLGFVVALDEFKSIKMKLRKEQEAQEEEEEEE